MTQTRQRFTHIRHFASLACKATTTGASTSSYCTAYYTTGANTPSYCTTYYTLCTNLCIRRTCYSHYQARNEH